MRQIGSLRADKHNGEGEVLLFPEFYELSSLTRADILKDWFGEIQHLYAESREELYLDMIREEVPEC